MKSGQTEADVLRACLQLLTVRGVFAWRSNAAAVPLPGGKGFRRYSGLRGVSDILAVLPRKVYEWTGCPYQVGLLLGIECKSRDGRQTKEQAAFQAALERAGGKYLLARCVGDLDDFLKTLGI